MAFSWKTNKKRIVRKLKKRIAYLEKQGDNASVLKCKQRLERMEKIHNG